MAYTANEYNYATPLPSAAGFTKASLPTDKRFFLLSDNVLDGSCYPISGDVGLWGTTLSNSDGTLSTPFVVSVNENLVVNAFRLTGSQYSYPIDFTVKFYNNGVLVHAINETGNNEVSYVYFTPETFSVTDYEVTITKISEGNSVAKLYNAYNLGYVKRTDNLYVAAIEDAYFGTQRTLHRLDTLAVRAFSKTHITNIIDVTYDTLKVDNSDIAIPTNVHTRMKDPSRRIYGKVYVTYTDPMLESDTSIETNMDAHNSVREQVIDGNFVNNALLFTLYDNDLSGNYLLMSDDSQVGWVSGNVSGADGTFVDVPYLKISFTIRPVTPLTVYFDKSHGSVAENFTVEFVCGDDETIIKEFTGNTSAQVLINDTVVTNVSAIIVRVTKVTKAGFPVSILEMPVMSTLLYKGYQDSSDLMSIDLLEELTYEDDVEALGGVSANEVTVVIDNSKSDFYFNNESSAVSKQLRRNRKVEPWLGTEIIPGEIEWYSLGTYWSYRWNVPVNSLTATVVGFDTIGLLDRTDFTEHHTLVDASLGELIEYVLTDAQKLLYFISWKIDEALYDIIIPYAWFAAGSHTAALRKISQSYPMHIYCDRRGTICAAPQKLHLDYYYDVWSDSTNVISKEYSSLYTTLPNIVNVTVNIPQLISDNSLVQDNLVFDVGQVSTRTLNFSKPYLSDIVVTLDKDDTVSYTYKVYSWGIVFSFTGSGSVRSINCVGTAVDISNTATLTRRNEESIRADGAVTRDVQADFIQTSELATLIINRIFALSTNDKYDATISYRGDIALSINDPILLLNGIAPDNRYNIRRHQLSWNGSLTGKADLNT